MINALRNRRSLKIVSRLLAVLVVLAAFRKATAEAPTTAPATQPVADAAAKFIRFVPDGNGFGMLELATVSYRNADGATVDLVGAVHIADPAFYTALNQQFKGYDSLLYEMVKPKNMVMGEPAPKDRPLSWIGHIQRFMQRSLDLQYQLDGIDYKAKNFVHADLDAETFAQLEQQKGESIPGVVLKQAVFEMGKQMAQPDNGDVDDTTAMLMALQSDDKPRAFKVFLGKQIASASGDFGEMDSQESTVLISGRNHAAFEVLKQRLAAGDKRLGIFYGVGHLAGMEKILTEQMGFTQVGPPHWRIAWDMTHPTIPAPVAATEPATAPAAAAK